MRILQLHTRYRIPAGEDSVVADEAGALVRAGHEVEQFVAANPTSTRASIASLAQSMHNRTTAADLDAAIHRFRPDVVHVHNTWFALSSSVIAAAAERGIPVVMTVHNYRLGCLSADLFRDGQVCTACVGRLPVAGMLHGCYRGSRLLSVVQAAEIVSTRRRHVLDRSVTLFVAPSAFMADRLIDIGLPSDRMVVKPHFVHDPGPRVNPPSASTRVLSVGRLAEGKGLDTLVSAWGHLTRDDLELDVIGDGPLSGPLRARAEAAPVHLHGWLSRDEVGERMRSARALVMPSEWYEPFGMVLVEAMSCGLPIVVTTAAGAASIVGAPDTLIAPPGDPAALARVIDRLGDRLVDEVGTSNRRTYEQRYTETVGVSDLERLYVRAIGAGRE